jgi:hypothetical protein
MFARHTLPSLRDQDEAEWRPTEHIGPVHTIFPCLSLAGAWRDTALVSQLFPGPTPDRSRTAQTFITRHPVVTPDDRERAEKAVGFPFTVVLVEVYASGFGITRTLMSGPTRVRWAERRRCNHFHRCGPALAMSARPGMKARASSTADRSAADADGCRRQVPRRGAGRRLPGMARRGVGRRSQASAAGRVIPSCAATARSGLYRSLLLARCSRAIEVMEVTGDADDRPEEPRAATRHDPDVVLAGDGESPDGVHSDHPPAAATAHGRRLAEAARRSRSRARCATKPSANDVDHRADQPDRHLRV